MTAREEVVFKAAQALQESMEDVRRAWNAGDGHYFGLPTLGQEIQAGVTDKVFGFVMPGVYEAAIEMKNYAATLLSYLAVRVDASKQAEIRTEEYGGAIKLIACVGDTWIGTITMDAGNLTEEERESSCVAGETWRLGVQIELNGALTSVYCCRNAEHARLRAEQQGGVRKEDGSGGN